MANNHGQGDSAAQANDYVEPCGTDYAWQTWENDILGDNSQRIVARRAHVECFPQQTVITPAFDGSVYSSDNNWQYTWEADPGISASTGVATGNLGAVHNAAYQIRRGFFSFDVSSVHGKRVLTAQLRIHGWKTPYDINVCAQQSIQSDPLALDTDDFQKCTGALIIDEFGFWDNTDWNEMDLNANGRAYLQSLLDTETTHATICTREYDHDYLNVEPTELLIAYCEFAAAVTNKPELVINWVH